MKPSDPAYWPPLTVRLGFAGQVAMAAALPICFAQVVTPWIGLGLQPFILSLFLGFGLGLIVGVLGVISMMRRPLPRWGGRWQRFIGRSLLLAWLTTFALGLANPLGLIQPTYPRDMVPMGWVGLAFLLLLSIAAWPIVRLLRDPSVQ